MDGFMRDSDAFSWNLERDPTLRSTVVTVAWLERSPDWDVLLAKLEAATRTVPMFRQRVLEVPGRLAPPRWTTDDAFDLTWHVRRISAPAPRTPDTVVTVARHAAETDFDRSRPLWECTLVEHLEGGRAALVMKLHHALTDGLGGLQLALLLFDREVTPTTSTVGDPPAGERLAAADLVREGALWNVTRAVQVTAAVAKAAVPAALHAARHPVATTTDAVRTMQSIARTVAPVRQTLSPLMTERSLARHLDVLEVRLDDLKRAAAVAGGSVNDGFMAGVTGGLRRYHEQHGAPVAQLRVTMPISIRSPDDPIGGNRITLIRFTVPTEPDPASRVAAIGARCRAARDERSLPYTDAIVAGLNLLPVSLVGSILKHVDFVASDVPGFPDRVYLAGARVHGQTAFGPTTGAAVNVTLLSYAGTCSVGINVDTAAVPDGAQLSRCLRDGFEEVLHLAGAHRPARLPLLEPPANPRVTTTRGHREPRRRPPGTRRAPSTGTTTRRSGDR